MNQFKKKLTTFSAMLTFLAVASSGAYAIDGAMNTNVGNVLNKTSNVGITDTGTTRTDVDIVSKKSGDVGQVDWGKFNVNSDQQVNFGFSGLSQTIINRVLGGDMSKIYGKLTNSCVNGGTCTSYAQTGKVLLINPAGVLFGNGSQVDLNSFTVSTFDLKNSKNLNKVSDEAAYIDSFRKGYQTYKKADGTDASYYFNDKLELDSNYTDNFTQKGLTINNAATVKFDGADFDHFNSNFSGSATLNTNKTLNVAANQIEYKDSLVKVGDSFNDGVKGQGNVRLITADGVTFGYVANGYADSDTVAADTKTDVARSISIDNSNKGDTTVGIKAGNVEIKNVTNNKTNSDINIKNTIIKGVKMVKTEGGYGEQGNIYILGSNDVNVENSRLGTYNATATRNGVTYSTKTQTGGEVSIDAGKNATVKDSLILTSGSKNATQTNAGRVQVVAESGNTTISGSKVIGNGNVKIAADKQVNLSNSLVHADNYLNSSEAHNVEITGADGITGTNTIVKASGDLIAKATDNNVMSGNITFSGTNTDGQNSSALIAGNKLSLQGKNTTLDNTSSFYETISFYNDGTTGTNNVTIKNNSTFTDTDNGEVTKNITLETNGNMVLDNATMKAAGYSFDYDRVDPSDSTSELNDNGSVNGVNYTYKSNAVKAYNVDLKSTNANVTVQNNSDVVATQNIKLTANNGNVTVKDSKLTTNGAKKSDGTIVNPEDITMTGKNVTLTNATVTSGRDVVATATTGNASLNNSKIKAKRNATIEATQGSVNSVNNSDITATNDATVIAKNTIKFGNKGDSTVNIDKTSPITAGHNILVKSTGANVEGEKTTMPTLTYGNRLEFNAKQDNIFTSADSLKSVNVDYVAGNANRIYTTGDAQFVDSTLKAPTNHIESGSDVIMNNLEIKVATTDAKDTVTNIYANGDITTKDVTGSMAKDRAQAPHTYPQSVDYNRNVTLDKVTGDNTTLNINGTKLTAIAETVKEDNPVADYGSITLNVKNANNANAGVELTAQNIDKKNIDSTTGYFKSGYYKSGTQKWDEKIPTHEGPEIHLNAVDDQIAVGKIITDKLTLDKNDTFTAADTSLTPEELALLPDELKNDPKGVIVVRDQGGLNLDENETYDPTPDGFGYEKNYNTKDQDSDTTWTYRYEYKTTNGQTTDSGEPTVVWVKTGDEVNDGIVDEGWNEDGSHWMKYQYHTPGQDKYTYNTTTPVTKTTYKYGTPTTSTTSTDEAHTIKFDNQGNQTDFILVYDKKDTSVEVGKERLVDTSSSSLDPISGTRTELKDHIVYRYDVVTEDCPTPPDVTPSDNTIATIRIPRENVEVNKSSKVSDNTVDQTSNIMSAAAKIDIGEDQALDDDDDK